MENAEKTPISMIDSYKKPEFLETLPSGPIEFIEGAERQVFPKCSFEGNPTPTVTWWIGNEPILENKYG